MPPDFAHLWPRRVASQQPAWLHQVIKRCRGPSPGQVVITRCPRCMSKIVRFGCALRVRDGGPTFYGICTEQNRAFWVRSMGTRWGEANFLRHMSLPWKVIECHVFLFISPLPSPVPHGQPLMTFPPPKVHFSKKKKKAGSMNLATARAKM